MADIVERLRGKHRARTVTLPDILHEAANEIERLRAIVRVNGLRWGHTHAEIDAILAPNFVNIQECGEPSRCRENKRRET